MCAVVVTAALLQAPATFATTVTFGSPTGSTYSVTGIGSGSPTGGNVTAIFNQGAVALGGLDQETVSFGGNGIANSAGSLWSLAFIPTCCATLTGNLGGQVGLGIDSLIIDLLSWGSLFDRTLPNPGTPNSLNGEDFNLDASSSSGVWDLTITYLNPIAVGAAAPVGDLYGALRIDFSTPFLAGDRLTFGTDTDTFAGESTLVPLPPALWLFGTGLLGLIGAARRKAHL
jgi:hypothetical protein